MKITMAIGQKAGIIGLLSILAKGHAVSAVVAYDEEAKKVAEEFVLLVYSSVKDAAFIKQMEKCDLFISVHCRQIISKELLALPKLGCINVHPFLYKFKGKDPVGRALTENVTKASVGVHYMTEQVDEGFVIVEKFIDVGKNNSRDEVYNKLYPYYVLALSEAFEKICDENENILPSI